MRYEHHEEDYSNVTKFDLHGFVIQEVHVAVADYTQCCEICAGLRPPSAPPSPPESPHPPMSPPLPPRPPPSPWAPFPPIGPADQQVQVHYPDPVYEFPAPSEADLVINIVPAGPPPPASPPALPEGHECRGIVFKTDPVTGNMMCFMKSTDRLQLYTEEDMKNNIVVAPSIGGDFVFTYNAVCRCF